MALIPIDVTTANLIPMDAYVGTIQGLKYQIKTGEKFNKDGISEVSQDEWNSFASDKKRLQYIIAIPGRGNIFHELYVGEKSLGFVKDFLRKAGVAFSKEGFDPDMAVGKQIGITVGIVDDPTYGESNTFKFYKV